MYQVIDNDGQPSEPMDINHLQALAQEGKLKPEQMILDPISGQTLPAEQMLGDQIVFPEAQTAASVQSAPATPSWNAPVPPPVTTEAPPPPVTQAPAPTPITYQPPAGIDANMLGLRLGGYLIDVLCSIPLLIPSIIPLVGLLFAPLLVLYWLSRDAFFGGQSVGKKVLGLKVVRLDGQPVDWMTSVQRNIIYAPLLLMAIPVLGTVMAGPTIGLINLLETVLVLTTGKRVGDNIAKTTVVRV